MLLIKNWQTEDFLNEENYKKLGKKVKEFLFYNMEFEAFNLYKDLSGKLRIIRSLTSADFRDKYLKLLLTVKFIALPSLGDGEVRNIVRQELAYVFDFNQKDLGIKEKFRKKLTTVPLLHRDKYKEKLMRALEDNEQVITQNDLEIKGKEMRGSIGNWVRDYYKFIIDSNIDEKLIKAEYLYKNKNIISLPVEDREKIKILLDLYDSWQKSSFTVAGRSEEHTSELQSH